MQDFKDARMGNYFWLEPVSKVEVEERVKSLNIVKLKGKVKFTGEMLKIRCNLLRE